MFEGEQIPSSWISAHRALKGQFDECLTILKKASKNEPFASWIESGTASRERYFRYVLAVGFQHGWVSMAQPRAGVCVATPIQTRGGLWSWWTHFRLRRSLSNAKRECLVKMADTLESVSGGNGVFISYLGVRRRFRKQGLARKLIRIALPRNDQRDVYVASAQPSLIHRIQELGGKCLDETDLAGSSTTLSLYRLEREALQRGLQSAA